MDGSYYKLLEYEWDYTIYSTQNDTVDSIDAEYNPELEWMPQPAKLTSTPKINRTASQELGWLLA